MIIIKVDCCGRPQTLCGLSIWTSSDAMRAKGLIWLRLTIFQFSSHPPLVCNIKQFNNKASMAYHSIIQKEGAELLAKGAIEPLTSVAGF